MRQLWYTGKRTLEWKDVPEPVIDGPGQAVVQPLAIARCDLDLPIILGATLFRPPFPVGHELTARVEAVSDDVTDLTAGQNVVVNFQIACGTCPACMAHHSPACATVPFATNYGLGREAQKWGGGISEKMKVPFASAMLRPIPTGLDPLSLASLSDNMTDGFRCVAPFIRDNPRARFLIIGGVADSIACYAILEAFALGAADVTYFDTDESRLKFAASLGARTMTDKKIPTRLPGDFDVTVDCSGFVEGFRCALRSARPYGECITVSIFFDNDVPIPFMEMYNKGVRVTVARTHAREQTPEILSLIASGRFHPERVTSHIVDFADAKEAWMEPTRKLIVRGA